MNRLAILSFAIIACYLYSCSPKIGENTSSSMNEPIISSPTTNAQTTPAPNIGATTTKSNSNVKEISTSSPKEDKIASFPTDNSK